jgi:hypothetical protein
VAATGNGESIIPWLGIDTNGFYTNAFYIGSDANGKAQARGAFLWFYTWTEAYWDYSPYWPAISNAIVAWQATLGGGGFGGMMMGLGGGLLTSGGPCTNCITGANVYFTNMTYTNGVGGMNFVFSLAGGVNGMAYDLFSTTNLWTSNITNAVWTWLGEGTNCGTYSVTNQPRTQQFYILGTPLDSDSDGLTDAYELLVSRTNPYNASSGGDGISDLYKLLHGLPFNSSVAVPSLSSISIPTCPIP